MFGNLTWTGPQWVLFASLVAIGAGLLMLATIAVGAVRRRRMMRAFVAPRRDRRALAVLHAPTWAIEAEYTRPLARLTPAPSRKLSDADYFRSMRDAPTDVMPRARLGDTRALPVVVDPVQPPDVAEHFAAGAGSLSTLREVGEGSLTRVTHDDIVDPDIAAALAAALDPLLAHFAEMMEHIGRRLLDTPEAALDRWRIESPTGEYPEVQRRRDDAAADWLEAVLIS